MKKVQKRIFLSLLCFSLLASSCMKKDVKPGGDDPNGAAVLSYLKELGYTSNNIVDNGKAYVVDRDMVFPKNMVVPTRGKLPTGEQYYTGALVNLAHQVNVKVRIDGSMGTHSAEATDAINLWNNANAWVRFYTVTSGEDIVIRALDLNFGTCGQALTPSNGLPGNEVDIDLAEVDGQAYSQRMINVAHELGHTIGFNHTNLMGGGPFVDVPGWGGTDGSSIMNGNSCGTLSTSLSYKDLNAVNALYPNPYPTNTSIDLSYGSIVIRWTGVRPNPSDVLTGYDVDYGGQSGVGFGGTAHLSAGTTSFTVPGVSSNPSSGNTQQGYVVATVKAVYATATYAGNSVSRYKSNGVWQ